MSSLNFTVLMLALAADPATPKEAKPTEIIAYFHDGTVIQKAVLEENVEITTRYGKLGVPITDIRQIDFAHRLPEDLARKIELAIKHLGSDQYSQREAAEKELIAIGKQVYPALQQAAQSKDKEVARRSQNALEKIRAAVPEEELRFRSDDVIYTRECVLTGKIEVQALKARTKKFGEMKFNLVDLKSIYSVAKNVAEVAVEAAPFQTNPERWHDTGLHIEAGMDLAVSATGKVDLSAQQPGVHVAEPDGYRSGQNMGYPLGTLLGRIGEKGQIFVIGKRYDGRPTQSGKLYVYIVPIQNEAPKGSYKVKATAAFALGGAAGSTQGGGRLSAYMVPAYTAPVAAPPPAPAPVRVHGGIQ
jgi:hypothetical protein